MLPPVCACLPECGICWSQLVCLCLQLEIFVWSAVSEPQLAAKTQWGGERFMERGAKWSLTLLVQGGFLSGLYPCVQRPSWETERFIEGGAKSRITFLIPTKSSVSSRVWIPDSMMGQGEIHRGKRQEQNQPCRECLFSDPNQKLSVSRLNGVKRDSWREGRQNQTRTFTVWFFK